MIAIDRIHSMNDKTTNRLSTNTGSETMDSVNEAINSCDNFIEDGKAKIQAIQNIERIVTSEYKKTRDPRIAKSYGLWLKTFIQSEEVALPQGFDASTIVLDMMFFTDSGLPFFANDSGQTIVTEDGISWELVELTTETNAAVEPKPTPRPAPIASPTTEPSLLKDTLLAMSVPLIGLLVLIGILYGVITLFKLND